MTLNDITAAVRGKLQDTSFDQTLITNAANWFVDSVLADHNIRFMEKNKTLFASAGDTSMKVPSDYNTMIKEGFLLVSPQVYELGALYLEYGDFMKRFPDFQTASAANPWHWTDFANTIRFSSPLLADAEFNLDYIQKVSHMVNLTDTCIIPDNYTEMVVLGALERCMQTNEDYGEASQEIANLQPLITAFVVNEGRGQFKTGPTIMRSNRRGRNANRRLI